MIRLGLPLLGLALVSFAAGCASVEVVPAAATTVTAANVPAPAVDPLAPAVDPLARDAELTGNEHHVSLLEGKITFKVHAVETPKIGTRSTSKGLLYSTLDAKLSAEQTIHCVAYKSMLWPGGFVANDLRGEHDWANDASEKPDEEAKTTSELSRLTVSLVSGRPTIDARATVKNEAAQVVADRKIIYTSTPELSFSCSDRTVGFDKRFHAFASEAITSLVVDPPPSVAPKKVAIYRVDEGGKAIGYRMVETYVDEKKVTTTYTNESIVSVEGGKITGLDHALTSVANARGEETSIHSEIVANADNELTNVKATRSGKGWSVVGSNLGQLVLAHYPAKTALLSEMSPAWMARVKAVATKRAPSAKLALFSGSQEAPSVSVAKRMPDGSVAIGGENAVSIDADGVSTLTVGSMKYERIRFTGRR